MAEHGIEPEGVLAVISDPSQVPAGDQPWRADFREWAWLKVEGAPMGAPHDAAEVVLGDGWCIANSQWGADDWIHAPHGGALWRQAQQGSRELLLAMIPRKERESPPVSVSIPAGEAPSGRVPEAVDPASASRTEGESTAGRGAAELASGRGASDDRARDDAQPQGVRELTREMRLAYRASLSVHGPKSRYGQVLAYPAEGMGSCAICDEPLAQLSCRMCNGSGWIGDSPCPHCDENGEHIACINGECVVYQADRAEELAEQEKAEAREREVMRTLDDLQRAMTAGDMVRFRYRGQEERAVVPGSWELIGPGADSLGETLTVLAFCPRSGQIERFTVERMTDLHVLGQAAAEGPLDDPMAVEGFRVGESVEHPVFGFGYIRGFSGMGESPRVTVEFGEHGAKTLLLKVAKLVKVERPRSVEPYGSAHGGERTGTRVRRRRLISRPSPN